MLDQYFSCVCGFCYLQLPAASNISICHFQQKETTFVWLCIVCGYSCFINFLVCLIYKLNLKMCLFIYSCVHLFIYLFSFVYVCMHACVFVCMLYIQVPMEAWRELCIPWSWSCRKLWMLGTNLRSSTWAANILNYWTIAPVSS